MELFFEHMNEAYIDKHYPKRSVFASVDKSSKKNGIGVYIFFGLVLVLFGLLTICGVAMTIMYAMNGESEEISTGIIISVFGLIFCAVSIWMILLTKKRRGMGSEGWLKKSAEKSGYSESEIREFDRQALASDSYILNLTGKIKAALSGTKPGIMTRDYIYLADNNNTVIKLGDLVCACLVERTFYLHTNNRPRPVQYLSVTLLSNKGVQTSAETSKEAGNALMELLREQVPEIETNGGKVMTEKDFDSLCKKITSPSA